MNKLFLISLLSIFSSVSLAQYEMYSATHKAKAYGQAHHDARRHLTVEETRSSAQVACDEAVELATLKAMGKCKAAGHTKCKVYKGETKSWSGAFAFSTNITTKCKAKIFVMPELE